VLFRSLVVTAVLVLLPAKIEAQPLDPRIYCISRGSCFAAAFQFTDYLTASPWAYTEFSVYLQNLQGSYPRRSRGQPLELNSFFIRTNNPVDESEYDVPVLYSWLDNQRTGGTTEGRVRTGDIGGMFDDLGSNMRYHQFGWYSGLGLAGCDWYDRMEFEDFRAATCPSRGYDGWLRLDFRLFFIDNLGTRPVRFDDFQFTAGNFSEACGIGALMPPDRGNSMCREFTYEAVATPEPATLLLLGPALVAVGGVRRALRRRPQGEPAEKVAA